MKFALGFGARLLALGTAASAVAGCARGGAPEPASEHGGLVLDAMPEGVGTRTRLNFEGKVELIGYDVEPSGPIAPGTPVTLRLYWRSVQALEPGWRLFTHLGHRDERLGNLDNAGTLRKDLELSPSKWQRGKIYVDEQTFPMPNASDVTVFVGVWTELELTDAKAAGHGDAEAKKAVGLRLKLLGGRSDGENRAIVTHLRTGP